MAIELAVSYAYGHNLCQVFPERLQYRADHRAFEVKDAHWNSFSKTNPYQRNMITLVRENDVINWLAEHRLPLLHESCLYVQYRLAKCLSEESKDKVSCMIQRERERALFL
jgi:hypothetical protein